MLCRAVGSCKNLRGPVQKPQFIETRKIWKAMPPCTSPQQALPTLLWKLIWHLSFYSTTETSSTKNLNNVEYINNAQAFRERFSDSASAILEYENSLLDFTQQFIIEAWKNEGENFVISPFSLHTVIGKHLHYYF